MKAPTPSARSHLAALVEASAALAALPATAGPTDVLAALYEQVAAMLGVRNFVVSLYDGDAGLIRCGYAVVEGEPWPPEQLPPLPLGSGPTSRVIRTGQPIVVPDVLAERGRWNYREVGNGPPVRSMMLAPMTRGGAAVGVVQAQSYQVDAFSADDAAALSVLANQAAAAVEAVRQREQAERAAARVRLLDDVGRLLGESLDLDAVLQRLAEQVTAVMGAGCAIYLLAESGRQYEGRLVRYRDPQLRAITEGRLAQPPPTLADTFIGRTILAGAPVWVADVAQAPLGPDLAAAVAAIGIRQALFAPVRRHGRVLGAIMVLGTAAYPLQQDDLGLATAVADRAAAAIEHARLHAEMAGQRWFLEHLIEAAPIAIAVMRGPDLIYEVANAAYRARLGGADIVGRSYLEVNHLLSARLAQAERERLEAVRTGGRPLRMTDVAVPQPDGSRRYISFDLSPLPAYRGRPAGVLALVWDTTADVLARERLAQLAQQSAAHAAEMEAIIAGMVEGVLVTTTDGTVRVMNEAGRRILGEAFPGMSVRAWDLISPLGIRHPDGRPVTEAESRALWETDRPVVDQEVLFRAPDGADRVLRTNFAPLPGPRGERAGTIAIFEDITERRALEAAREEFLAQASHELRTPLTSTLAYLQLAARRLARAPAAVAVVGEAVEVALAQAQRLRELVNDLLDATRMRQGRLELRRQPVDLAALVAAVVADRRESSGDGSHTFQVDTPAEPVVGEWDEDRLRQVFVNLLDNAVKYSPAGGNVWVRVQSAGPDAVVTVQDEGIGIPECELPKLFQPFGRAEHAPARNIPGFGLGLYICRDIVERHGGRISVTSRPGDGSTFAVTLPRMGGGG